MGFRVGRFQVNRWGRLILAPLLVSLLGLGCSPPSPVDGDGPDVGNTNSNPEDGTKPDVLEDAPANSDDSMSGPGDDAGADDSNEDGNEPQEDDSGETPVDPVDDLPSPGACCLSDGTCLQTLDEECNGAFIGPGTECGLSSCNVSPFADEAMQRGITYLALFPRGEPDVVPGSGIGFLDLDLDDDLDMMVLGRVGDGLVGVYENDGTGRFTDRSADSGIPPDRLIRALAAGDYDDDGDWDVYLSYWTARNGLFRNDGDFHFTDVTEFAGVGHVGQGSGCSWGDYDGDQRLDLYVSDYGIDRPNRLYRNRGDGSFEDVAPALGVTSGRRTMQGAFLDFDGDADMDLYVANDLMGFICPECCNELYRNDGGVFSKMPDESGANACLNSMCIAVGDVDNNLALDFFFTDDFFRPGNILILNQGDGTFVNASTEAGINPMGAVGWGAVFFDYDNDGYEELFVTYNTAANQFYENDGRFPLTNVASSLGLDFDGLSYCTAVGDVDDDGDLDLAVWSRQQNIRLYMNQEGHKRRWAKLVVIGEGRNKFGIGATVTISAGGRRQIRHLMAGNNFKGQDSNELHFGLDTARTLDEIVVLWPGGTTRTLTNYAGNKTWKLYPPSRLGDANGDGVVGADDLAAFDACLGVVRPGCEAMDVDGNGDVNDADRTQR